MSGVVVWITGKPSSGKTSLGRAVQAELEARGVCACLLDGDEVRAALVPAPGYDAAERDDFYATLAGLAALLARQNRIVLVAATAHRRELRARARALAPAFVEVWVDVPQAELERRDTKGLYAAVRAGRAHEVPGADLAYEPPEAAELTVKGGEDRAGILEVAALAERRLRGEP